MLQWDWETDMRGNRFGEVLSKLTTISEMDVEEILQDQKVTHRRFGEIALSWGLCEPKHIWHAWYHQLATATPRIDLDDLGVDAQAVARVPRDVAVQYNLIPVRISEDQLVVAIAHEAAVPGDELINRIGMQIRYVRASTEQIQSAIETYYEALRVSA
jgi:type IV pilus assembly protein PilB